MSNQTSNFQSTYENVMSCLLELGFVGVEEIIEDDSGKFITGIQDQDFGMLIEITCRADIVNIKLSTNLAFEMRDMLPFYQLLNELNLRLMDIGHFAINDADGDVVLQTSIDLSDDNFNREQMLTTIQRISIQGLKVFKLINEMFESNQCPFYFLHNYIEEMRESQVDDEKTIH